MDTTNMLKKAAQTVADKNVEKAAFESRQHYDVSENGLTNIAVPGDGTWRRRGYRSSFGVVLPRRHNITFQQLSWLLIWQ